MTDDERADYIAKRLVEVKDILDEIAERTGVVFIVFNDSVADVFARIGESFSEWMRRTRDILGHRYSLAWEHNAREENSGGKKEEAK